VSPHFNTTTVKKIQRKNSAKAALFAGATALMTLTPQLHAQSSDALIDKLEQKGILTADEAKQLRVESQDDFKSSCTNNFASQFDKAFAAETGTPDWVTGYKFGGDFRGRFDDEDSQNPAFVNRIRLRYRLRVGLVVNLKDDLQAGFSIASDGNPNGSGGDPLSNNTTLTGNGTKKYLYINTAYGKWTPIHNDDWTLSGTFGKMDNPFQLTPMVFDPELTPEGGALQTTYDFSDTQSLSFNGAAFVLLDSSSGASGQTRDPFMYGGQVTWNAKWTPKIASSLGVSAFAIVNGGQLTTANFPLSFTGNQGNSRNFNAASGSYVLTYDFNPIIGDASVTYTLDSFPFYKGAFPVKLAGEIMDNPAAPSNNKGYWGGFVLGKCATKGTWDISYRYEYLEQDAWWDQEVDDDNVAYYAAQPNPGWLPADNIAGGTNIRGHLIRCDYALSDGLTFTVECYINDLINQTIDGVAQPKSDSLHLMADLMWKF
jgi:hypothetical protein